MQPALFLLAFVLGLSGSSSAARLRAAKSSAKLVEKLRTVNSTHGSVHDMHGTLTELVKGGYTPDMQPVLDNIKGLLQKDMQQKVVQQQSLLQQRIAKLAEPIGNCSTSLTATRAAAAPQQTEVGKLSTDHQACRKAEATAFATLTTCQKLEAQLVALETSTCDALASYEKANAASAKTCEVNNGETYAIYMARLTDYYTGLNKKWGELKSACDKAKKDASDQKATCVKVKADYDAKKAECNKNQDLMDATSCVYTGAIEKACTTYDTCYTNAMKAYNDGLVDIRRQERDMQSELETVHRMICMVDNFKNLGAAAVAFTQLGQTPLVLTTDGYSFKFTVDVKFSNFNEDYPQIVVDSANSFQLHGLGPVYGANQGKVTFYINTATGAGEYGRGGGLVYTKSKLTPGEWYTLTVEKTPETVCLSTSGNSVVGTETNCVSRTVGAKEFQMKQPGKLTYGTSSIVAAKNFAQVSSTTTTPTTTTPTTTTTTVTTTLATPKVNCNADFKAVGATLTLTYPTLGLQVPCAKPTDGAGSAAYVAANYKPLPADAPAKQCAATACCVAAR